MNSNYKKGRIYHLFDSNNYYILKRGKKGNIYHVTGGYFIPMSYLFTSLTFAVILLLMLGDNLEDIESLLFFIIFIIAFLFFGLQGLIENIKLSKVKNFKCNGGGIVKKLKVDDICTYKVTTKNRTIDVFYVKVKDGNNTYFSNAYKKGEINGTSHEELKEIYKSYGFHYDEDQTKKREILQEIDRIIAETEFEIDNGGFLGNISRKRNLAATKEDREKVEYGYIPPYWQVEGNKISVGDMVDVYINPDKPDIYWVDIDFLFEK